MHGVACTSSEVPIYAAIHKRELLSTGKTDLVELKDGVPSAEV